MRALKILEESLIVVREFAQSELVRDARKRFVQRVGQQARRISENEAMPRVLAEPAGFLASMLGSASQTHPDDAVWAPPPKSGSEDAQRLRSGGAQSPLPDETQGHSCTACEARCEAEPEVTPSTLRATGPADTLSEVSDEPKDNATQPENTQSTVREHDASSVQESPHDASEPTHDEAPSEQAPVGLASNPQTSEPTPDAPGASAEMAPASDCTVAEGNTPSSQRQRAAKAQPKKSKTNSSGGGQGKSAGRGKKGGDKSKKAG